MVNAAETVDPAAAAKAKADKAKIAEERLKQKKVLESCLTLVRSLYTREEVMNHCSFMNDYRKTFKISL